MKIQEQRGQSMAEFVIVIPVFLILFVGIYQFSLISIKKIDMAILERELIRTMTDREEKGEDVQEYVRDIGERMGFDRSKLRIVDTGDSGEDTSESPKGWNIGDALMGKKYDIVYSVELMPVFESIMGKDRIELRTTIKSATGGVSIGFSGF